LQGEGYGFYDHIYYISEGIILSGTQTISSANVRISRNMSNGDPITIWTQVGSYDTICRSNITASSDNIFIGVLNFDSVTVNYGTNQNPLATTIRETITTPFVYTTANITANDRYELDLDAQFIYLNGVIVQPQESDAIFGRTRVTKEFTVSNTSSSFRSKVVLQNLPTSSSGLSTGQVWNDLGTLKIVT